MPFTLNGVGTWYYGKRRIHTLKGACQFCGRETDLESYDTTLYFVVVFLPVIPLAQKRILQQCAVCRRHRVASLAEWEEAKRHDCADLLEMVGRSPPDRDAILRAIGLSLAYQDEPMFNTICEALAGKCARDAAIQSRLGDGYAFFSRWPSAEEAYAASLAVDDNAVIREQLAWALLKQDRPDEARPYVQHVNEHGKRESAGLVYFLVKGYQAQGRHEEALAIMDERDQAFPDLVSLKEYKRQRKDSMRYRHTDKKIRSTVLADSKAGYREGNWTARLPRWIAAFVVLGGLGLYLGSAAWIGQARKVYLINGTSRPYTVVVQGTNHALRPNSVTPIRIAEGELQIAFSDANLGQEPVLAQIETPFWTRPFTGPTFVINPDQSAVVLEEESYYAANNPRMGNPPVVHFGRAFYSLDHIDYEFESFPRSLQVNQTAQVRKTRVTLASELAPEARLGLLQKLDPQDQIKLCQKFLRIDPSNSLLLYWLSVRLSPEEMIRFVEPRFDLRPILVDWHRIYQSQIERAHPDTDLRPRYRKLLAENEGNADALYLLGRADPNPDEGDKLIEQAATANIPSGQALYALGYRAMCAARFADATRLFEKATPLVPEKTYVRQMHHEALLANGDYDQLLQLLQMSAQVPGGKTGALTQMMRVNAIRGDKDLARQKLVELVELFQLHERDITQKTLESILSCCEKDVEGFLKAVGNTPSIEGAILRGQLKIAGDMVGLNNIDASAYHGLLYLEATRSGAKEIAEIHWNALLADLNKNGREEKRFADILAAREPKAGRSPQRLSIEPRIKRVLLAVFAQRFPDQAMEALPLAKQLDYQQDAISLCLAKFLQQP
jgi:tetratricopeptide (TPR) repeat protein